MALYSGIILAQDFCEKYKSHLVKISEKFSNLMRFFSRLVKISEKISVSYMCFLLLYYVKLQENKIVNHNYIVCYCFPFQICNAFVSVFHKQFLNPLFMKIYNK